ncbi:MAG: hypothetical protein ACYS0K_20250 [Planctomycetota bacterium]
MGSNETTSDESLQKSTGLRPLARYLRGLHRMDRQGDADRDPRPHRRPPCTATVEKYLSQLRVGQRDAIDRYGELRFGT